MSKLADLAPAEFEVMEVLWNRGESTTKQVLADLTKERKLAYNTVATVLTRLREKGYVDAREQNFAYVYRAIVERTGVVDRKLDDLVSRVLKGSLAPLAVYIAKKKKLTKEQISALEDIIKSQTDEES